MAQYKQLFSIRIISVWVCLLLAPISFFALLPQTATGTDFGDLESGITVDGSKNIDTIVGNKGLVGFIAVVINIVLGVIIGIGLIVFVIGGFVYMMAGGDAGKLGTAKTIMGAALLGIALAIAAQLILNTLSPQFAEKVENPALQL